MQYADSEGLSTVSLTVSSPSAAQGRIVKQVTGILGDALLDGNGAKLQGLQKAQGSGDGVEGVYVSGTDGGLQMMLNGAGYDQVRPTPLPPIADTRSAMEKQGLKCGTENGALSCEGVRNRVSISAQAMLSNGAVSSGWTVSVSPESYDKGKLSQGARVAAQVVQQAGLTDPEGAKFIAANPQDGRQGDFIHYGVQVTASASGGYYSMLVSIDEIN